MNDELPSGDQVEVLALSRAMALVEIAADPAGAAKRVKELKAATAAFAAKRSLAEKAIAEADEKMAVWKAADENLFKRVAEFQGWVDGTEKSYRDRETRIRTNEEAQEKREVDLVDRESDLGRRTSAHDDAVAQLKRRLAS